MAPEEIDLTAGQVADDELIAAGYGIDEHAGLLANLKNGAWLDRQVFPPLRYHLPRIIPEGSTLFVGPPKIGKSWFVLGLGLAAAGGGRMLGLEVEHRPVLYLALEDGDRRLQERCRSLLGEDPIPEGFDYITAAEPGAVLTTIRLWLAEQSGAQPTVILDTLGRVMPPAQLGESSYQRDYRIGAAIKRLADDHPGLGIIVNHHDRKAGSDDFVERVSGTNGLAGAADTIVVIARPRHQSEGVLQVTGRDVAEGEYAVSFDGTSGLWALDGTDLTAAAKNAGLRRATMGVGDLMTAIIELVDDNADGVGPKDVAAELGIPYSQATMYLSRAVQDGRLTRPKRGLYKPCRPVDSVALQEPDPSETNKATLSTPLRGGSETPSDDNRELWR